VLRFAPSPNGALHLGHALSALFGADLALRLGGRFRVRIEDIDPARSRPEHVAGVFRDLAWLGIGWEEPVVHQSTRIEAYRAAAARLDAMGLLYPCFASRAEIAAVAGGEVDPDGAPLYPGLWRHAAPNAVAVRLASGAPHVMRLDMTAAIAEARRRSRHGAELGFIELAEGVIERRECRPERWGDVVLQRKDTPTSYHLAVVVDDAHEGITYVTRGRDLLAATDVHRLLQVLLELPEPVYVHHRLMTDSDGRKLSKSARDTSLASLRAAGVTPEEVRRMVGLHDGGDVAQQLQRIVHLPG
jgi:glutamyl-Q tRNA(Asp) synthetase